MSAEQFIKWAGIAPEAADALRLWEFVPLVVAGKTRALAAVQGSEIHFVVDPQWRGRTITARRTRAFLAPLFDRRGFLTTRAEPSADDWFLKRMGFALTWNDGTLNHYMMSELPFGERN